MNGTALRQGRLAANLTQVDAAAKLRLSQPYLSQLEQGARPVTPRLARAAAKLYPLPPTSFALPEEPPEAGDASARLPHQLAALGYEGYAHLRKSSPVNPAAVALEALSERNLDARVAEAMPWLFEQYAELDWKWLAEHAKRRDVQNRLGFLVTVARGLAGRRHNTVAVDKLKSVENLLEHSRLVAETTLGREDMLEAEREWLREHRSPEARHWNVLAGMRVSNLPYAP